MQKHSCQSCLMPLKNDPGPRESDIYCSNCYRGGKLLGSEGGLEAFQKFAYQGMIERGMNPIKARIFTWMIRFAPRWRKR